MNRERYNIFLIGVGGQGIGLLSEVLIRAADYAGWPVAGVDTHGLAQRGGTVTSHLRLGDVYSPLVPAQQADLVIALERHEALRGQQEMLAVGGTLLYYNCSWQPLSVRLGQETSPSPAEIAAVAAVREQRVVAIEPVALADVRLQNCVLLAALAREGLVPRLEPEHYERALADLLPETLLIMNITLFRQLLTAG